MHVNQILFAALPTLRDDNETLEEKNFSPLFLVRGVDVNKRTVTIHFYNLRIGDKIWSLYE